jgi:molybdopterin converting factor small subunit
MKIEINLFASLAVYAPAGEGRGPRFLEVEPGTTIREVLNRLGVPPESVKMIFLNGVHGEGGEVLKERDRIGVFPPVAGG